jgi:hypothetical protein
MLGMTSEGPDQRPPTLERVSFRTVGASMAT